MESELQNTKAIVETYQNMKEELENQIQILKNKVEQMSLFDPNFSITSELGKLSIKDMELKTLQEDLAKARQDIFENHKLLKEILANQELMTQQLRLVKDILIEAKYIIWDYLSNEMKKLKEYFIQIEDERQLASSCLANLLTHQENLGDKPL